MKKLFFIAAMFLFVGNVALQSQAIAADLSVNIETVADLNADMATNFDVEGNDEGDKCRRCKDGKKCKRCTAKEAKAAKNTNCSGSKKSSDCSKKGTDCSKTKKNKDS